VPENAWEKSKTVQSLHPFLKIKLKNIDTDGRKKGRKRGGSEPCFIVFDF
jgi:hypothetical protein